MDREPIPMERINIDSPAQSPMQEEFVEPDSPLENLEAEPENPIEEAEAESLK
jgi:hypothetical protein